MTAAKLAPDTVYTVFAIENPLYGTRDPWTRIDGKVAYGIYSIYSYIRVPHIWVEPSLYFIQKENSFLKALAFKHLNSWAFSRVPRSRPLAWMNLAFASCGAQVFSADFPPQASRARATAALSIARVTA